MSEGCFDFGKGMSKGIRLELNAQLTGNLREGEDSAHPLFIRAALPD
jgi:hypothetical protein